MGKTERERKKRLRQKPLDVVWEAGRRARRLLMSHWPSVRDDWIRVAALQSRPPALFLITPGALVRQYVYH